ncbi:ROK family transcriptional regulator [Metabacillus arenae]|uniref:ROK family transcriptional regulator n=1 Tax=Metabacillus arenae TaxID=2771434 RepID=A0A926NDJ1_9BACI|nr:ROK family transcriptional regulator [Metabacillus arenae]MBD1381494.1 ROK family transcriptional regulator [Metabacillus arenae]
MQPITWNQQVVKKNNKAIVFETILKHEPLSRADIAHRTGLNKATVSSLVNELIDEKLIYESGPGESSGGRRPVLLHFNKATGFSIGIDIGVNYVLGVLTDLRGNILAEKNETITDTSIENVLQVVDNIIRTFIQEAPNSRYEVIGIGIGVPGIVDNHGKVLLAPNLGWENCTIKNKIEEKFSIPTIIVNEANAGAYGEKQFGAGQDFQDIIYVSAGIGIGAGLIVKNELYHGINGYSGEMGHMIIQMNGKPCKCGGKGCWEAYASEYALLKNAPDENTTLPSLIEQARENNSEVIQLFEQIGFYLGIGINNIINTFNPEQIIIGNRLAMAKEWLETPIYHTVEEHTLKFHQKDLKIKFSQLSIYSAALGVSAFAVECFINRELRDY